MANVEDFKIEPLDIDEKENTCKQSAVMLKLQLGVSKLLRGPWFDYTRTSTPWRDGQPLPFNYVDVDVGSGIGYTNKLITKMSGQNVPRSSQFLRFFWFCGTTEQSSITWTVTRCAALHGNPNSLYIYSIIISLFRSVLFSFRRAFRFKFLVYCLIG